MKKLAFTSILVMGLIPGAVLADDLLVTCKSNPPEGIPQPAVDAFCACADKETTGNAGLRTEILQGVVKEKSVEKRMAAASDALKAVSLKCQKQ